uniref:Uncharacterized protein n=1 Tax=Klebsiella pneumoniae TaxID=573 RepID=A0A6B7PXT6_KLEPN|nr:hypothetical protein [Klebsiella pneumoniae]QFX77447.1 hypothetical protein [Klebsiella pneumoniae]
MHSTKNSESQRNGSANVRRPSWLTQLIGKHQQEKRQAAAQRSAEKTISPYPFAGVSGSAA